MDISIELVADDLNDFKYVGYHLYKGDTIAPFFSRRLKRPLVLPSSSATVDCGVQQVIEFVSSNKKPRDG
jgi:hypothetical protein